MKQQGARIEDVTDELGIILFNDLAMCVSPVLDSHLDLGMLVMRKPSMSNNSNAKTSRYKNRMTDNA